MNSHDNSLSLARSERFKSGRSRAVAAALIGAGLLGAVTLSPLPAWAQRGPDATVQTPFGRAPLSFADIVDRVKPAVVSISVKAGAQRLATRNERRGRGAPPNLLPNLPEDHPLHEFFKNFPRGGGDGSPRPTPRLAQGSGFVISADGYVVTNNHVIDGADKIEVSFSQKRKYTAKLVGADSRTDLALLKIESSEKFQFVRFAERQTRVGDWVVAVGNPFGLGGTVTAGIVSAHGRDIGSGPYDYIQIDAAVNRGNSGGPTFNLDGEVVGVNTAIYSPSGGNVGIAFAVPAKTATEVVKQLQNSGSVSRGWLGVKIQNVDEDMASSLGLGEARGALVSEVTAGGPAQAAGLEASDVVLAVDGEKIADSRDLARKVANHAPDSAVRVLVLRRGKEQTVSVKLGKFPSGKQLASVESGSTPSTVDMDQLGLTLAPAPKGKNGVQVEGVVVTAVDADADAALKGLKAGDIILGVGGQKVSTPEDVEAGVKAAHKLGRPSVFFRVKSGDQIRFVAVKLRSGEGKKKG